MLRKLLTQLERKKGLNPNLQSHILESLMKQPIPKKSLFYWPSIILVSSLSLALLLNLTPQEKAVPLSNAIALLNHWNDIMDGTAFGPGKAVHIKSAYEEKDNNGEKQINFELWTNGESSASQTEAYDNTDAYYTATLVAHHQDGSFDSYEYNAPSRTTDCREEIGKLCDYLAFYVPAPLEGEALGQAFDFNLSISDTVLDCLEQSTCIEPGDNTKHMSTISHSIREDVLGGEPVTVVSVTKKRTLPSEETITEVEEYWFDEEGLPIQILRFEKSQEEELYNYSSQTFEVYEVEESMAPLTPEAWEEQLLGVNAALSPRRE